MNIQENLFPVDHREQITAYAQQMLVHRVIDIASDQNIPLSEERMQELHGYGLRLKVFPGKEYFHAYADELFSDYPKNKKGLELFARTFYSLVGYEAIFTKRVDRVDQKVTPIIGIFKNKDAYRMFELLHHEIEHAAEYFLAYDALPGKNESENDAEKQFNLTLRIALCPPIYVTATLGSLLIFLQNYNTTRDVTPYVLALSSLSALGLFMEGAARSMYKKLPNEIRAREREQSYKK